MTPDTGHQSPVTTSGEFTSLLSSHHLNTVGTAPSQPAGTQPRNNIFHLTPSVILLPAPATQCQCLKTNISKQTLQILNGGEYRHILSFVSPPYILQSLLDVSGWRNVSELRYALFMNDEKIINIVRAILGPEQDRSRTNYPGYKYPEVKH